MGLISQKLRNSARGEACVFGIPGICSHDRETTMLCHAPSEIKGMGNKGHDFEAAVGCHACHTALDQHRLPREQELFYWLRGVFRTWRRWIERGLIVIPVDPVTAKTRPGKKANMPSRPMPKVETQWPSRPIQSRNSFERAK